MNIRKLSLTAITAVWTLAASAQTVQTPPATLVIDSQDAFDQWTQINNNAAGNAFKYDSYYGGAYLSENRYDDANDWLIAPAVELTAGTEYKITLTCKKNNSVVSDYSRFTINTGNAPTVDGLTDELYKNENFTNSSFTEVPVVFTPETSGTYYFGIHVYNVYRKGGFVVKSLAVEKVVPRPAAITGLTVTAAPEGAMEAELSWTWPDKSDLGGTLESITGAYIYRGTTSYFTADDASLIGTYETAATPGTKAEWTDNTVTTPGKYYYRVIPFNENGTSPSASTSVQSDWIGPDTRLGTVTDFVATPSTESETTVLLTFTAPTGYNGGYVNPESITYKITRTSGSGTTVTLEDAWAGEQPYVDSTIPSLDSYSYTIYPIYNGSTGTSTKSNTVVTGGTAALPYSQDFSTETSKDLYTFFHGEGATRDWSYSSKKALSYWGSPADAWVATPKFHLEKGKAYELDFDTYVSSASSPKVLYLYIGTEPTIEGLDREIFHEEIKSTFSTTKKIIISVDEDGDFCIAFRCYGPSDYNDIFIDNIKLAETVVTPRPVTDASATPAPEGELKAVITWTNPALDTAGGEIGLLDHVDVLLNNEVVASVDDTEGGVEATATVPVDKAGVYKFSIIPYLGENAGDAVAVTSTWIGPDTPKAPDDVNVETGDNGRVITFDAVTEGVNGGYINPDEIVYTVTRNGDVLTDDLTSTSYTDDEEDLPLAKYTYAVSARYGDLESAATAAAPVQLGDALDLPYKPSFASADDFEFWTSNTTAVGTPKWKWSSGKYQTSSSDAWAFTPPLTMQEGTISVKYTASAYNGRNPETFQVLLTRSDDPENPETVEAADPVTVTNNWDNNYEASFTVPTTGKYYVAYHLPTSAWTLSLSKSDVEQTTVNTGVDDVTADAATGEAVYYNLNGVKVDGDRLAPGLYIKVRGDKAEKVTVK